MRNEMKRYKETTIHRFKCTLKGHKFISNICNVPANLTVYLTVMDVTQWEFCVRHQTVKLFWYQVSTAGESASHW